MRLSKYFTLGELIESDVGYIRNIPNVPSEENIKNLKILANTLLDPVRVFLNRPVHINSGYRSVELNKAVDGVANSVHIYGLAGDIAVESDEMDKTMEFIKDNLDFDQAIVYPSRGFIHVGLSPEGYNRNELLESPRKGVYIKYKYR